MREVETEQTPPAADALALVANSLGSVLDEFPTELRDALTVKFCAEFDSPMTCEMELALRKRLTDDEVRHVMFSPTPAQYRHYATLLSLRPASISDDGSPEGATSLPWPLVLQKRFLTLFYLKHARNWALVVEFVLLDGLQILAELFLHRDLQIRGQAIDCFIQITSSTAFDWFQDPVGYQAKVLHSKMVALAAPGSRFLSSLVQNIRLYDPTRSSVSPREDDKQRLPGGTYVMLQVIAFFLSWVRKLYAQPKSELRLSSELLGLLRDWRARTQTQDPAELELAQQVFDDFSRWPPIGEDALDSVAPSASQTDHIAVGDTQLQPNKSFFSRGEIQRLLERTSDDGEVKAIKLCTDAISVGVCLFDAHLLRATAFAQRVEYAAAAAKTSASKIAPESYDSVQRCLGDCAAVLRSDEANVPARKLRLRVLSALEMWSEALEVLDEWVSTDRESLAATFLPADIAFFTAQREVAAQECRAKALGAAREQRLNALRLARQEEIFLAILKRDQVGRPTSAKSIRAVGHAKPRAFEAADAQLTDSAKPAAAPGLPEVESAATTQSLLSKFMVSSTSKSTNRTAVRKPTCVQDPQTAEMRRGQAFARKLRQAASDRDALSDLVAHTPLTTLSAALASALSDDQLLVLFDVLNALRTHVDEQLAARATDALRVLTRSVRFQLVAETAADATTRERIRSCVDGSEDASAPLLEVPTGALRDLDDTATGATCA